MLLEKLSLQLKNICLILGITLLFIILGHFAIGGARFVKHKIKGIHTGQALVEDLSKSPIFAGYDGYAQYFKEAAEGKMLVKPYYHWRRGAFNGEQITVDENSIRKTIKSPKPGAKKVFMFGGSTMWGTGSPNQYTIASFLQKKLGDEYDVYNFGETAFVSVQELNLLLEVLAKGFKPDIVIFYDGVNDIYASLYSPAVPRDPQFRQEDYANKESLDYLLLKLINKTNYLAITERIKILTGKGYGNQWDTRVLENYQTQVDSVIDQYRHLIKQVKALGDAYGFESYHFWQPLIFTKKNNLHEAEQPIYASQPEAMVKVYEEAYRRFSALKSEQGFHYIADVFDNVNEPIYFDFCHMGPKGNELIASRMHQAMMAAG